MRIVTLLIVAVASVLAAGCSDRRATYFATYSDAQNANALGPGKWLPTFLPVSATEIREQHDIDTNALWVSFTLGGDFDAPPSCSPSVGDVALGDRAPGWWRQAVKAMDSPTQLYQCADDLELGGYWARSKCFLWTGLRTAVYRCSPATLEPKAKSAVNASKSVPPPSLPQLAGVWLGGQTGALEYFRLALGSDGTGNLTVQYLPSDAAVAYTVTSTTLSEYAVTFHSAPIDPDAEPIFLRGRATPATLTLEVGGTDGQWHRSLRLEREEAVKARIRAVEDRANELTKVRP